MEHGAPQLVRYLEHPKSGAMSFEDMGPHWVTVRDAVQAGTLRANDKAVLEVASRFEALMRFAALRLGRRLGAEVTPVISRAESLNPALRPAALAASLAKTGTLAAALRTTGRGGFIDSVLGAVDVGYEEIGQRLKPWAAAPHRLRSDSEVEVEAVVPSSLPSAALSSQDE